MEILLYDPVEQAFSLDYIKSNSFLCFSSEKKTDHAKYENILTNTKEWNFLRLLHEKAVTNFALV